MHVSAVLWSAKSGSSDALTKNDINSTRLTFSTPNFFVRLGSRTSWTCTMVGPSTKSKTAGGGKPAELWVDMSKVRMADGRLEICQLSRLLQLIRRRDFDAIANLVAQGVPSIIDYVHPAATDPTMLGAGQTVLGLAADANDDEMLEFLLGLGANPSVYDLKGRTAAMRAAELGHVQSMRVLAQGGTDMKVLDEAGQGSLVLEVQWKIFLINYLTYSR